MTPWLRASSTIERPSGVSSASEAISAARIAASGRTPGAGDDLDGHAIAEGDRAGLVEQQRVDVAGGLDGATGGGEQLTFSSRSMPAMPTALSRPPIVVGISVTNRSAPSTIGSSVIPEIGAEAPSA